jgi:phage host-nuclease inhibitor protein Gam
MTESLRDEHHRLMRQMDDLKKEHEKLERNPHDSAAHKRHHARLRRQIEQLQAHLVRIRSEVG